MRNKEYQSLCKLFEEVKRYPPNLYPAAVKYIVHMWYFDENADSEMLMCTPAVFGEITERFERAGLFELLNKEKGAKEHVKD